MRILHVLNGLHDTGNGIVNVAVDLALEQRRLGHEVFVASAGGDFVGLLRDHAVEHVDIDFRRRRPVPLVRAERALMSTIRRLRPDVLHAHTITPTVLGWLVTRRRRPVLIATVHNEYQPGVGLMRLADGVVGVSHAVSRAMAGRGVPERKLNTVVNGTVGSLRRSSLAPEDRIELPPQSIVTVGAVSERKGADVLLAAFERLLDEFPAAHLYYVGNLDWPLPYEETQKRPWRDQVHFVGFDPQPQRYLQAASVFVLASRRDPFPLVVPEAFDAGLPVVASAVDGLVEALDFGRAGLLARGGDPEDLATKISSVLRSEETRRVLVEAGRRRVSTLTVEAMAARYVEIYRSAVAR
jgi:glycosyltransferase involved in cell wall biosynthesis